MISQNSFSYIQPVQSPRTPRFNLYQSSSRTFNPSSPILSLTYLNSQKALTTPQHLPTLPSSTTSFGRMKSDKSIKYYHNYEDKQNIPTGSGNLGSMEFKGVKNVNEIQSEFKKIISQFESKKQELEKNFSSPFEIQKQNEVENHSFNSYNKNLGSYFTTYQNTNLNSDFNFGNNYFSNNVSNFDSPDSSCYVIKQITEQCNTSTAEDFNQQINYIPSLISEDNNQKMIDESEIWNRIYQTKTKSNNKVTDKAPVDDFYMNTFGNVGWTQFDKKQEGNKQNRSEYSNKDYPFYIINLKLPDKTDQLVYYPSVPIPQFAASVVQKHNINPEYIPDICEIIQSHIAKNRVN